MLVQLFNICKVHSLLNQIFSFQGERMNYIKLDCDGRTDFGCGGLRYMHKCSNNLFFFCQMYAYAFFILLIVYRLQCW